MREGRGIKQVSKVIQFTLEIPKRSSRAEGIAVQSSTNNHSNFAKLHIILLDYRHVYKVGCPTERAIGSW